MLRNYLTVAWRALRRRPGFSALNVIGLAVGLACVILIGLWVADELSYDDFHPNADRTYRVLRAWNTERLDATVPFTPSALAPTLKQRYAQVEAAVRVEPRDHQVERDARVRVESNTLYADAGFFEMFGFEMLRGTARLDEPGTVVLTPTLADRYFPDIDPIGQPLRVNERDLTVTGIAEAPPSNTHLDYSLVASLTTHSPNPDEWGFNRWRTYVTLTPGTEPSAFEANFAEVVRSYAGEEYATAGRPHQTYHLQPTTGIHLGVGLPSNFMSPDEDATGSLTYVYLFAALAAFVLVLAAINFINLSTARSARRANEVGVRKAVGAGRGQLAGQFLGESVLLTALGLVVAVALCAALLPLFNDIAGKAIARSTLIGVGPLLAYGGLLLVVGGLAGGYPAFVLSGYRPTDTLRGQSSSSRGSPRLRQALVVFQFSISIALLVGTAVVHQQVSYITSKDLGFQKGNVLVVEDETRSLRGQIGAVTQSLESKPGIQSVAAGYSVPGSIFLNTMWGVERPDTPAQKAQNANYTFVGDDYVETLGLRLAAGRDFSPDRPTDTSAVMINEAALQKFGYRSPQAALGDTLVSGDARGPIIGVVENFHYESLHKRIYPLVLAHEARRPPTRLVVRHAPGRPGDALQAVRDVWRSASPLPLTYSFLANDLAAQYEAERRLETLFVLFAGLAVLIACLGLFGMAAYAAHQRTKEIGIRKALGATATHIVGLLSRNFLALVGIAFVVAVPVAYLAMQRWLATFAYRVEIGVGVFVVAGLLAAIVAGLSVSYQAWTAAQTDPARTLRGE